MSAAESGIRSRVLWDDSGVQSIYYPEIGVESGNRSRVLVAESTRDSTLNWISDRSLDSAIRLPTQMDSEIAQLTPMNSGLEWTAYSTWLRTPESMLNRNLNSGLAWTPTSGIGTPRSNGLDCTRQRTPEFTGHKIPDPGHIPDSKLKNRFLNQDSTPGSVLNSGL
jgi:hypothetical protein